MQSKFICFAECENNRAVNNLFIRYKAEAMPEGESIQNFCLKNKVPYNLFHKWYKDTRHRIVPVQVEGQQVEQESEKDLSASVPSMGGALSSLLVRFMIDIRITGGMHIQQRNLSYSEFEKPGREAGWFMLNITGMNRFYYLHNFHDLCWRRRNLKHHKYCHGEGYHQSHASLLKYIGFGETFLHTFVSTYWVL